MYGLSMTLYGPGYTLVSTRTTLVVRTPVHWDLEDIEASRAVYGL